MANSQAIGRMSARFEMEVERGEIREFAPATGSRNASYLTDTRPVMLPTFLTTQAIWQGEAADPWLMSELNQLGGLHAEQEYIFHGSPPRAGTKLTFQTTIIEVFTKQGRRGGDMTFVVALTKFWDEDGRLVAEAQATAVETSVDSGVVR